MTISKDNKLGWYVASVKVGGLLVVVGFGLTHADAICDAFAIIGKCHA